MQEKLRKLLFRHCCIEYQIFIHGCILQAMRVTLRAIQAVTCLHIRYPYNIWDLWWHFCQGAFSLKDEYHFTTVFMTMHADGRTRNQSSFEDSVCTIKIHICSDFSHTFCALSLLWNLAGQWCPCFENLLSWLFVLLFYKYRKLPNFAYKKKF